MQTEIKAGDYVKIISLDKTKEKYQINDDMIRMRDGNDIFQVWIVGSFGLVRVKDNDGHMWNFDIEDVRLCRKRPDNLSLSVFTDKLKGQRSNSTTKKSDISIIFNDPATILIVGDEKFVSKAHNEEFDPEKGLLMCIAKYYGYSHLDLQRLLKVAVYQNKPQKEEPKQSQEYKELQQVYEECGIVEKQTKSPKGKHVGQPYRFQLGEKVVVRDCYTYKYQNRCDALKLLNKEVEVVEKYIGEVGEACYSIEYKDQIYLFAGSELEPILRRRK